MDDKAKWNSIGEAEFDGDVLITDPCYLCHGSDDRWDYESVKSWIEGVGGLVSNTFYGDWGCTLYQTDGKVGNIENPYKMGNFCADSGLVCVVPMESVRNRYPRFDAWLEDHTWCGVIVNDFSGKVRLMTFTTKMKLDNETEYDDVELRVRGDGEIKREGMISFESVQTSL